MVLCLFHTFNKYLRAVHQPGTVLSPAIHLWVRYMDPQPSGSLYFCKKDRKEISTQVNNIIKYFHEP